jgi:hypothetical protein
MEPRPERVHVERLAAAAVGGFLPPEAVAEQAA